MNKLLEQTFTTRKGENTMSTFRSIKNPVLTPTPTKPISPIDFYSEDILEHLQLRNLPKKETVKICTETIEQIEEEIDRLVKTRNDKEEEVEELQEKIDMLFQNIVEIEDAIEELEEDPEPTLTVPTCPN